MRSMEGLERLSVEVCSILESPCTPDLKRLYDVLENTDLRLVQCWGRANGCQIGSLAGATLNGLQLWPYALDILKTLAHIPSFRDAVLHQEPMLLHTLLAKAIESESAFDKYAATCVSLLSSPLDLAIPSSFPPFLMQLVERAVSSLSPETIRPVYRILSAIGSTYLDIMSIDVITRLQSLLNEVLRKTKVDEDQYENLLCLAILAKFASRPRDNSCTKKDPSKGMQPPTVTALSVPTDVFASARKYFANCAYKTFDLITMKASKNCSQSCALSLSDVLESLKLSEEIVDACDPIERKQWIAKSSSKVKTLQKKILRQDIGSETQCAAINLLVALSDGQQLHPELLPIIKRLLMTPGAVTLSSRATGQCLSQADEASIGDALINLLSLACSQEQPNIDLMAKFSNALHLASTLNAAVSNSPSLRRLILGSISSNKILHLLRRFATQAFLCLDPMQGHRKAQICPTVYAELQIRLHQKLSSMILSTTLRSEPCEEDLGSILDGLLEKQTTLSNTLARCKAFSPSKPRVQTADLFLFEAKSTPQAPSISHEWKDAVFRQMSRDTNCRYESIIRLVEEVYRDLELRCNEAERPLRNEQSKSHDLQESLENAQAKAAELESQAFARTSELEAMQHERNELEDQVKVKDEQLQDLQTSIEQILQDYDRERLDAKQVAQHATDTSRLQDLTYIATMTAKDAEFEEQAQSLARSEARIADQEHDLAQLEAQIAKDVETMNEKDVVIDELNSAICTANELTASRQADIDSLTNSEMRVVASRDELAAKLQEESDRNEASISRLEEVLQSAKTETSRLQHEHDLYASSKVSEILHLKESHRSAVEKLQVELDKVHESAAANDEQSASKIAELQHKNKGIRKKLEERSKELAEAQDLPRQFMALAEAAKNQKHSTGIELITSRHRQGGLPLSEKSSPSYRGFNDHANPSFDSSTSNKSGPTPKRMKIHRSSPPSSKPSTKSARHSNAIKAATRRNSMRARRNPLAELQSTQNHAHFTPTQNSGKESFEFRQDEAGEVLQEKGELRGLDSEDDLFGGRDFITSIDYQQLSASRNKVPRDNYGYDETTTDL